jgi:hypothetical protein
MIARERSTDERSATAKAELELKGKSLEAIKRIMRRETRMSLRPCDAAYESMMTEDCP